MRFEFTLRSVMPLLVHADDSDKADILKAWRMDPDNKLKCQPGDDRSPAWTWITYLYSDGAHLAIPADNVMVALREAGSQIKVGRGNSNYKKLSQSGLSIDEELLKIVVDNKPIEWAKVEPLLDVLDFATHVKTATDLGFRLFTKRAKVGQAKHLRVRARFDQWALKGHIETLTDDISEAILKQLFDRAGQYAGLCDWRPSSPKAPGPFGKFKAELKAI